MTILVRIFYLVLVLGIPLGAGDPGERMYQKAILPSGAPMRAALGTGPALPGTSFACASCHLRSGLGAADEGAFTPAIHAPRLFQPAYRTFPRVAAADRQGMGLTNPPARPAYTDATLAQAIRTGIDPSGRVLNAQMPRYQLDDPDMALLIAYLRTLSASPSPGVDGTTLRFATVIDGAAPEAVS